MIARALMHAPQVLFLDEPATGLDPAAKLFVWDRLRELRDQGVTLVLTTHDMDEAAALSDRVGIMDHGKLLALDTPEALMRSVPSGATLELTTQPRDPEVAERIVAELAALPGGQARGAGRGGCTRGRRRQPGRTATCACASTSTDDAPLLVAPAAGVLAGARRDARRREARDPDARGRLHRPHGQDAQMTELAAEQVPGQGRVFLAVLQRDLYVTWGEFPVFLAQVILQPFFLLFVFGKVLGSLGYTQPGYADLLCSRGSSR